MQKEVKLATMKEVKRYQIVQNTIEKKLTQKEAAKILKLTTRQIRNIKKRITEEGEIGIIHRSRGKPSNNKIPEEIKQKILELSKTKYAGFRPTFLAEKLEELENILVSRETVRKILTEEKIWKPKNLHESFRKRRDRRETRGELIQLDGSIHDWFGTGEKCWLINFADDATSEQWGKFTESESTQSLMQCVKEYILKFGCPAAFYVDKDSIYRVNRPQTIEEQLSDEEPVTQFTRAMNELGIEVICANSPQAKGRVERSFKTHQDRLVKENILRGIKNIEDGNKYLPEYYEKHNKKFGVLPKSDEDSHIPLPKNTNIDGILSFQVKRSIAKDYTVQYKSRIYQLLEIQKHNVLTRNKVIVENHLDGSIHIRYKDVYLNYEEITDKQAIKQIEIEKKVKTMTRKEVLNLTKISNPNSPWRIFKQGQNFKKGKF
jgi:transposase